MNTRHPSVALLAVVSGLGPFGMAILLPALPAIAQQYDQGYSQVQLVVSGYLLGVALAQPISGFLCDRFGRRRVILIGLSIFIVASIGAAFASSLTELVAYRMLQASGVSAGTVVSRAIVRDVFAVAQSTQALSKITMGLGIAPVVAPMVGGWLIGLGDMRFVFLFSAVIGVITLCSVALKLPETLSASAPKPALGISHYTRLLRSRPFLGYTLIFGFVQGSFFAFLAVGAAIFENSFGLDAATFGLVWGGMAIAYVLGAMAGGRLSTSGVSNRVLPVGVWLTLIIGLLMLAIILSVGVTKATVLLPMVALMAVSGAVTPLVMAGAVQHHPDIAGLSAGFSSALGLLIGNVFVVLSGVFYAGNFLPIAVLIAASTSLTAISWLIIPRGAGGHN